MTVTKLWQITCFLGACAAVPTYLLTHLLTHSFTHSVEQSPSGEAKRFPSSQEIPRILWNSKDQYHIYKRPPTVPILSKINPVHDPTS